MKQNPPNSSEEHETLLKANDMGLVAYGKNMKVIWTLSEPKSNLLNLVDIVYSLYASGDELIYILNKISGIPEPNESYEFTWYGDIARTIILNI